MSVTGNELIKKALKDVIADAEVRVKYDQGIIDKLKKELSSLEKVGTLPRWAERCAHCGKEAFKSDGTGTLICENYANYGSCSGGLSVVPAQSENVTQNNDPCPCGSGKKFKKCCK